MKRSCWLLALVIVVMVGYPWQAPGATDGGLAQRFNDSPGLQIGGLGGVVTVAGVIFTVCMDTVECGICPTGYEKDYTYRSECEVFACRANRTAAPVSAECLSGFQCTKVAYVGPLMLAGGIVMVGSGIVHYLRNKRLRKLAAIEPRPATATPLGPSVRDGVSETGSEPSYQTIGSATSSQPLYQTIGSATGSQPLYQTIGSATGSQSSYQTIGSATGSQPLYQTIGSATGSQPLYQTIGSEDDDNLSVPSSDASSHPSLPSYQTIGSEDDDNLSVPSSDAPRYPSPPRYQRGLLELWRSIMIPGYRSPAPRYPGDDAGRGRSPRDDDHDCPITAV